MSEPVQLAKAAREHLAAALRALQAHEVPPALEELAEPIAAAMGVLHKVERTNGADLGGREDALQNVRTVLDKLQHAGDHPAVETVMEEVAQSLGKVHALVRYAPPAPAPAPAPEPAKIPMGTVRMDAMPAPQPAAPAPQPQAQPAYAPQPQAQPAYAPQPQAQPAYAPQPQAQPAYAPQPQAQPAYAPQPQAQPAYAPQPQAQPAYAPAPQPQPQAPAWNAAPQQAPAPQAAPAARAPEPPKGAQGVIDVELGTHSPSNFYKGLGGNDVIEHGGIFVSTYKVQKIGTNVVLRVLLPGDYEFQANAVVQWIRSQGGSDEPGFGARFTHITPEGRQLVYRYTRNREPMFYDDL
jgi:hypothetical protein